MVTRQCTSFWNHIKELFRGRAVDAWTTEAVWYNILSPFPSIALPITYRILTSSQLSLHPPLPTPHYSVGLMKILLLLFWGVVSHVWPLYRRKGVWWIAHTELVLQDLIIGNHKIHAHDLKKYFGGWGCFCTTVATVAVSLLSIS